MPDTEFDPETASSASSAPAAAGARPWLQALKEADERRPDLPGEHLVVLGLGLALLLYAGRSRSLLGRLAKAGVGGALIGRAASGTGGVARLARIVAGLSGRPLGR